MAAPTEALPLAGGDARYPPPPLAGGVWVGVGVEAADADDCIVGVLCCCGVDCCWSKDCDWKGLFFSAAAGAALAVDADAAGVGDDMLIPAKALVTDDVLPVGEVAVGVGVALGIDAASGLEAWVGWLGMPLAVGDIMDWATPPPTVPPPPVAAVALAPPLLVGVGAGTGVGALSRPANGSIPAADMAPKPCACC